MRSGTDPVPNACRASRSGRLIGLFSLVLLASCAGRSRELAEGGGDAGDGAQAAAPAGGFGGTSGAPASGGASVAGSATGGDAGEPPFTDPGCPDVPAPPGTFECSLFGTPTGCDPNEGCYPTLDHPFGMGCEQQTHGSRCAPAGIAVQGEFCPNGMFDCASGFVCIAGAQVGSRCMQACPLDGSVPCPLGLICRETDARDVGVCS